MKPQALIFDLDGTLLDTLADIGNAMNSALRELGFATHSLEAYRGFIGKGLEQLAAAALPQAGTKVRTEEVVARFREFYSENLVVETRLYPGIAELLDGLQTRALPMAILSNKPDAPTQTLVKKLLGKWRFLDVRGERTGIPRKPDPQAALSIAAALGVAPQACAFIGDSAVDIHTATAAGMLPIGVLWGFRGRGELESAGAAHLLHQPQDLFALLE